MSRRTPNKALAVLKANHFRALQSMFEAIGGREGDGEPARLVRFCPSGKPEPSVPLPPLPGAWLDADHKPLQPLSGWSQPEAKHAVPIAVVAMFGLHERAVRLGIEEVARQQFESGSFVPVFFTDSPDLRPFRAKGYVVEYFPAGDMTIDAARLHFRQRFQRRWNKWGASRLIDLSGAYLRALIDGFEFVDIRTERSAADQKWERKVTPAQPVAVPDIASLRAEATARGLSDEAERFVLYRIIGNDLYPRHADGQSLRSVRFILEHEPDFADCEKRWVVNRISDPDAEQAIIRLLDDNHQPYLHIPFEWSEYAAADWDFSGFDEPADWLFPQTRAVSARLRLRIEARLRRHKINYSINNNGARNAALADGRSRAKWVLPWDGNCFLSQLAWDRLVADVTERSYLKYFQVPMARLTDNALALTQYLAVAANEEPQLIFRRDAEEVFNEAYPYGRRPKVELLWRLGIPGTWDEARDDKWDLPRPERSERATEFGTAGWVARLDSGRPDLEAASKAGQSGREGARNEAIVATLDNLDRAVLARSYRQDRLAAYDERGVDLLARAPEGTLAAGWRAELRATALEAMGRGPFSVIDKIRLPPSGDVHDYWHPAPYWWPNPGTADGFPLVRRDGERIPGSDLYSTESDAFDRTRVQRLFDDVTVLALASRIFGDSSFADHAATCVRRWFIEPATRMNPHLKFAQWIPERPDTLRLGFGIIEMKDFYYFLDAVRLLQSGGAMTTEDCVGLKDWLVEYLKWLQQSAEGQDESAARNNHGTAYDLQVAAIALFVGDLKSLSYTLRAAQARLLSQIAPDGSQPDELARMQSAHYSSFNVQCWINLAQLAQSVGCDLWRYGRDGTSQLASALGWLLPRLSPGAWTHPQEEPFDHRRQMPLRAAMAELGRDEHKKVPFAELSLWPSIYFPHDGIKPFWFINHLNGCAEEALLPRPPRRKRRR